jgi:hypothetical protein
LISDTHLADPDRLPVPERAGLHRSQAVDDERLTNRSSTWGLILGGIAYFLVLFDFRLDPLRTAVRPGFGSNFFDLQAKAFMHGRLSVPNGSLGIEGFVVHGKTYMYFPPFPALLRIPVMLVTHEFDGRLTLLFMSLAWVLFAAMTAKLYWLVRHCIRGGAAITRAEATYSAVFLAAATGGTVLVFDASLPWVYDEVYLWSAGLVVGTAYWLIRVSLDPRARTIYWVFAFALAAILTRTTGGWAMCLAVMATGGWLATGRPHPDRRQLGWAVVSAGVAALFIGAAYNFVKFRHPYLFPLQDQVWTAVNERRREALARNGGSITGPQFLPTSLVNYFRPDGIRFIPYFPYITLPAQPARSYDGVFLDQAYRTGSITAFMPLPFLLSILGCAYTMRRRVTFDVRALRLPVLGTLAVFAGVLGYGYITYRYTSDAVPFLVVAGAVGTCAISQLTVERGQRVRTLCLITMGSLAVFGALANVATGFALAAQTWGGNKLTQYVAMQQRLSSVTGNPLRYEISYSTTVPQGGGHTDELRIVGSCAGLYLNTGDQYQPWVTVEQREQMARIHLDSRAVRNDLVYVYRHQGPLLSFVAVETRASQQARLLVIKPGEASVPGPWFDVTRGQTVILMLRPQTDASEVVLYSSPGGLAGQVPLAEWGSDWISRIDVTEPSRTPNSAGVSVTYGWGPQPTLCRQLAATAGIKLPTAP